MEVLSRNSSCKDEFYEDYDFTYFDYVTNDLEHIGNISDVEKLAISFYYYEVIDTVVGGVQVVIW
jgi:hypothetical protein